MALQNLSAGTYPAKLTETKLIKVEKTGQPCVVLKFDVTHDGQTDSLTFRSFINTLDGTPNKKTLRTLVTIGMKSRNVLDLNHPNQVWVDKDKPYLVTVERSRNDDYWNITWVNEFKETSGDASAGFDDFDFSLFNNELSVSLPKKEKIKNYADDLNRASDDDIPF